MWIVFFICNIYNYNVIFILLESVVINLKKELVYRFIFDFFFLINDVLWLESLFNLGLYGMFVDINVN